MVTFDLVGLRAWMRYFHFMFKLKKNLISARFGGVGGGGRKCINESGFWPRTETNAVETGLISD